MTQELIAIDITTMPEVTELARAVARTGRPHVLRHAEGDLAVLSPARPARRPRGKRVTDADRRASLATFGAWQGQIDADRLKRDLNALQVDEPAPTSL